MGSSQDDASNAIPAPTDWRIVPTSVRVCDFFSTGFYSGYLPKAPGTWGTLAALILLVVVRQFIPGIVAPESLIALGLLTALAGALMTNCVMRSGAYQEKTDPQQVVIDEFAGFFITAAGTNGSIAQLFLAFACFRLFDITKPPPVRQLENLPMGWGVMADDLMAGVYGLVVCVVVLKSF